MKVGAMSEQPPPPPPPPPPAPGPTGGQPVPGVPRPGELLDRFLARLIDGILLGIVFGICQVIFTGIFISGLSTSVVEYLLAWLFISIIVVAVSLAYFGYMESNNGATLGKQLLKLKVVGPDGASNPTMEQALRRNAFYAIQLVYIVPIVGWIFGPIAMLAAVIMIAVTINNDTVNRQGWHDKFAGGTRVLKIG
jgi:uncharacterized RDD family membrane protein YckC